MCATNYNTSPYWFVNLFSMYLLSIYCVPNAVLGAGSPAFFLVLCLSLLLQSHGFGYHMYGGDWSYPQVQSLFGTAMNLPVEYLYFIGLYPSSTSCQIEVFTSLKPTLPVSSPLIHGLFNLFIHLFNKYLVSTYHMPGAAWSVGDSAMNKTSFLLLYSVHFEVKKQQ